jgi:DNA-binding beta-propeller fold protein YncE
VTPITLATMAPAPAVAVGGNPTGIAGAPSSNVAYVSGGDSVTPFNWQTRQAGSPFTIGTTAEALAIAPGGTTAWVCGGGGTLVHVSLTTRTVLRSVVVGGQPSAVVIAAAGSTSG